MKKLLILLVASLALFSAPANAKDKTKKAKDTLSANVNRDSLLLALTKEVKQLKSQDHAFKNQLGGMEKKVSSRYNELEKLIDQKAAAALTAATEQNDATVKTVNGKVAGMETKVQEMDTHVQNSLGGLLSKDLFWIAIGALGFLLIVLFLINWSKTRGLKRDLEVNYEKKAQSY